MRSGGRRRAFTLIEVIGVLAIIAILAAAIAPSISMQIRRAYADSEDQSLQNIAAGFKNALQSRRVIQVGNGWADSLAPFLEMPASAITRSRGQGTRRLVLRPSNGLTWNGTLYDQRAAFSAGTSPTGNLPLAQPLQARLMLIGDVSQPVSNANISAAQFDSIWNGSPSAPAAFRESEHLRIVRISLANYFVPVTLNILASAARIAPVLETQWAFAGGDARFFYSPLKRADDRIGMIISGKWSDPFGGVWESARGQSNECSNSAQCQTLYPWYPNPTCPGGMPRVCRCGTVACASFSSSSGGAPASSSSGSGGAGGSALARPSWSVDGASARDLPVGTYTAWLLLGSEVDLRINGVSAGRFTIQSARSFSFDGTAWSW